MTAPRHQSAPARGRGVPPRCLASVPLAFATFFCLLAATPLLPAQEPAESSLPWIAISSDGKGFQTADTGNPFTPWGFNYDHDRDGRLIEDYWHDEWSTIVEDFREMKDLGANVVRIHLQFARFMKSATDPDERNLRQLARLLRLAEQTGLHLDLTGLGCYHKKDVPSWYDAMGEAERWAAQAAFWTAVAKTCAGSAAVFCYDLMNEPVAPAGKGAATDWLGPALGGKHFVQRISLDQADRDRTEIARQWIATLVAAIRAQDRRHLITVGLVDWSLERPGLQSGFAPAKIAADLDFICVHLYPKDGKLKEDIETLAAFAAAGKPVVIEETFPLGATPENFATFIEASKAHARGWIGFYWGQTLAELEKPKSIPEALTKSWLEFFKANRP